MPLRIKPKQPSPNESSRHHGDNKKGKNGSSNPHYTVFIGHIPRGSRFKDLKEALAEKGYLIPYFHTIT